jgi:lycopene beta-cyclase
MSLWRSGRSIMPASIVVPDRHTSEYLLVGGGLQNSMIALALLERRPAAQVTLIEREGRLGGNHTWCFHSSDAPARMPPWLARLIEWSWPAHDVCFRRYRRRLHDPYFAITSARLHAEVSTRLQQSPNARLVRGNVSSVAPGSVTLEDGRSLSGQLVIDARGPEPSSLPKGGYQKFLGLELQVASGSAPLVPILMDATVPQIDGFRFMYVLPFERDRVLLEDTYYSTDPELRPEQLRQRIHEYAREHGIEVRSELREERGVLPIPTTDGFHPSLESPVRAGYAGGLFHPTTGYSLPVALRFALLVASLPAELALGARYRRMLAEHRRQFRFCLWLNRLLFGAFAAPQRHAVLERFYRLPAATIRRFYALETLPSDRLRILCGSPPKGFSLGRLIQGDLHS